MFQKKRTQKTVQEKKDAVKPVMDSREMGFPLGETAHLRQDALEAGKFTSQNAPWDLIFFRRTRIKALRKMAGGRVKVARR